ncbi:MAG: methyltransferase domain-containing protein [Proteobacteria bacterium]|nr:methyltransferase domain-containing protein [Pseudomonadota bacterium]
MKWRWEDYFVFTNMRNPWELVKSLYCYGLPDSQGQYWWERHWAEVSNDIYKPEQRTIPSDLVGFKEWVHGTDFSRFKLNPFIYDSNGNVAVDFIVKSETLAQDIEYIAQKIGVKIGPISHSNKTSRQNFNVEFDSKTAQRIHREFAADIFFGGYSASDETNVGKNDELFSSNLNDVVMTPQMIAIGTVNVCNSRCTFCPSKNIRRKRRLMPMDLFRAIVLQAIKTKCWHFRLGPQLGDSLLDPLLPERIQFISDMDIEGLITSVVTNLIALDRFSDQEVYILLHHFSAIAISLGPNNFVYKTMFGVDRFEKVLSNLNRLAEIHSSVDTPAKITINGRACGDDFTVDSRLEDVSERLTGTRHIEWTRKYFDWGTHHELPELPLNTPVIHTNLPRKGIFPCWYALNPKVHHDGRLAACSCAGFTDEFVLGNLKVDNLVRLLESPKRKAFLSSFIQGGFPTHCRRCSFYMPDRSIDWSVLDTEALPAPEPSPAAFFDFSYAKTRHFKRLSRRSNDLYSNMINPSQCDLKVYQDLLVFSFLKNVIPPGSRILEVGGGNSRVLGQVHGEYDCWNLDKFEGLGHGPKSVGELPYKLVRAYIGEYSKELPEDYFDFVFSISALEHVAPHDSVLHERIVADINRVLKPGGYSIHCFDVVVDTKLERAYYDYIYYGLSLGKSPPPDWPNRFKLGGWDWHWGKAYIPEIVRVFFNAPGTLNKMPSEEEIIFSVDVWTMSQEAFDRGWKPIVKRSYLEVGRPTSVNVLWRKMYL